MKKINFYLLKKRAFTVFIILIFTVQVYSMLGINAPVNALESLTFFHDDFNDSSKTLDKWNGCFERKWSIEGYKIHVESGQIAQSDAFSVVRDASSSMWIKVSQINIGALQHVSSIKVLDGNTSRPLHIITSEQLSENDLNVEISKYILADVSFIRLVLNGEIEFGEIKLYSPKRYYHDFLTDGVTFEGANIEEDPFSSYTKIVSIPVVSDFEVKFESPVIFIPFQPQINLSFLFNGINDAYLYNYSYSINVYDYDSDDKTIAYSLDGGVVYEEWGVPAYGNVPLLEFMGRHVKFEIIFEIWDPKTTVIPPLLLRIYSFFIYTQGYTEPVSNEFSSWDYLQHGAHTYHDVVELFDNYFPVIATDREGYVASYSVETSHFIFNDFLYENIISSNYTTSQTYDFSDTEERDGVSIFNDGFAYRNDFSSRQFMTSTAFELSSSSIIAGLGIYGTVNIEFGVGRTLNGSILYVYEDGNIANTFFLSQDYQLHEEILLSVETTLGRFAYKITLNDETFYHVPRISTTTTGGKFGFFTKFKNCGDDIYANFYSLAVSSVIPEQASRLLMTAKSQQQVQVTVSHDVYDPITCKHTEEILGVQTIYPDQDNVIYFPTPSILMNEHLHVSVALDPEDTSGHDYLQTPVYFGPMWFSGIHPFNEEIMAVDYYSIGETSIIDENRLVHIYDEYSDNSFIASYDVHIAEPCLFEIGAYVSEFLPRIAIDVYTRELFSAKPFEYQGTAHWTENEIDVFGHVVFLNVPQGDYEVKLEHTMDSALTTNLTYIIARPIGSSANAWGDYTNFLSENSWKYDFTSSSPNMIQGFDTWQEEYFYTLHRPSIEFVDDGNGGLVEITDWTTYGIETEIFSVEENIAAFTGRVSLDNLNIPVDPEFYPYLKFDVEFTEVPHHFEIILYGSSSTFHYIVDQESYAFTQTLVLSNMFVEDSLLSKIEFDNGNSEPVIIKNICFYRIKDIDIEDIGWNVDCAPYVTNTPYENQELFYIPRLDNIENIHQPFTDIDILNNIPDDYYLGSSEIPIFITNTVDWKKEYEIDSVTGIDKGALTFAEIIGPEDIAFYPTGIPAYLNTEGTEITISLSIENPLNTSDFDDKIIFEIVLQDSSIHWLHENGFLDTDYPVYSLKICARFQVINETSGEIFWEIADHNNQNYLPEDQAYIINYGETFVIKFKLGRPACDTEYISESSKLFYNEPNLFLDDNNYREFEAWFTDTNGEQKEILSDDYDYNFPLFTSSSFKFYPAPLSYDIDWGYDDRLYPQSEFQYIELLNKGLLSLKSPIDRTVLDASSSGTFLSLPYASQIIFSECNVNVSEYLAIIEYGSASLSLSTLTEGYDEGIIGVHRLSPSNPVVYEILRKNTKPVLETLLFNSGLDDYCINNWGYSTCLDSLFWLYEDYAPSASYSFETPGILGGSLEVLDIHEDNENSDLLNSIGIGNDETGLAWETSLYEDPETWWSLSNSHSFGAVFPAFLDYEYQQLELGWIDQLYTGSPYFENEWTHQDKLGDDIPYRILNYADSVSEEFLLRTQLTVPSWNPEDALSVIWTESTAIILPPKNVLRITVVYVTPGWGSYFNRYSTELADEQYLLSEQFFSYIYIGRALLGCYSYDTTVDIDFNIFVQSDEFTDYDYTIMINSKSDKTVYEEGLDYYQYFDTDEYITDESEWHHFTYNQDIFVSGEYHLNQSAHYYWNDYTLSYEYQDSSTISFENPYYYVLNSKFTEDRHNHNGFNSSFSDTSFGLGISFGSVQFTYLDYIPISQEQNFEEIEKVGINDIGTAYPDALIMFPNSKFRTSERFYTDLDCVFDLNLLPMLDPSITKGFTIGISSADSDSNFHYYGLKFLHTDSTWTQIPYNAISFVAEPNNLVELDCYENFYVRMQYIVSSHTLRFWVWRWDNYIQPELYTELVIDPVSDEFQIFVSSEQTVLFIDSISSNEYHPVLEEQFEMPVMEGSGEIGDYYLQYQDNPILNCTGHVSFTYEGFAVGNGVDLSLSYSQFGESQFSLSLDYYNATLESWKHRGFFIITDNSLSFGSSESKIRILNDSLSYFAWHTLSLSYEYVDTEDDDYSYFTTGRYIITLDENEYYYETLDLVDTGYYRITLTNIRGTVSYDDFTHSTFYEGFEDFYNNQNRWDVDLMGGMYDISSMKGNLKMSIVVLGCSIYDGRSDITLIINDDFSKPIKDTWTQSSPFFYPEYHHYVIPADINTFGNSIVKVRFYSEGYSAIYGFYISPLQDVESIAYVANTYDLEEQQIWESVSDIVVEPSSISEINRVDSPGLETITLVDNVANFDLDIEGWDNNYILSGSVYGTGKILLSNIKCVGDILIDIELQFGSTLAIGYADYVLNSESTSFIDVVFPVTSSSQTDSWEYFEFEINQLIGHIPYTEENGRIEGLNLDNPLITLKYIVTELSSIISLSGTPNTLFLNDFKYTTETTIMGEFPSIGSKVTYFSSDSDEFGSTSASWEVYHPNRGGWIDLDSIFERGSVQDTIDNYYFMTYVSADYSDMLYLEMETWTPFVVYQAGTVIYTKSSYEHTNELIPISVMGGITPLLFKIIRPNSFAEHFVRISYVSSSDLIVSATVFQQNEFITQWITSNPFEKDNLEYTPSLLSLVNDICPQDGERVNTTLGYMNFEKIKVDDSDEINFETDLSTNPLTADYIFLYTNLYFSQDLMDSSLIFNFPWDGGLDLQMVLIDGYPLILKEDSPFMEISASPLFRKFTIPLLDTYTLTGDTTGVVSIFRNPVLNAGWEEDFMGDSDSSYDELYTREYNLNSTGFHRVLLLLEVTDSTSYLNMTVQLSNRRDVVCEVLEPSTIRMDYSTALDHSEILQLKTTPHSYTIKGRPNVLDNLNTLRGGLFRDNLGGFHTYRIYSLGTSNFETLPELSKDYWYIIEQGEELDNLREEVGDSELILLDGTFRYSHDSEIVAVYTVFMMHFGIAIDEQTHASYMHTYSMQVGMFWYRYFDTISGQWKLYHGSATTYIDEFLGRPIDERPNGFRSSTVTGDSQIISFGDFDIMIDKNKQTHVMTTFDPNDGVFTSEGYYVGDYLLLRDDTIPSDELMGSISDPILLDFNHFSNTSTSLLGLQDRDMSNFETVKISLTNSTTSKNTDIYLSRQSMEKIVIDSEYSDYLWYVYPTFVEAVSRDSSLSFSRTFVTQSRSWEIYSNELDTYSDFGFKDNPSIIASMEEFLPKSLNGDNLLEPSNTAENSIVSLFRELTANIFNKYEEGLLSDSLSELNFVDIIVLEDSMDDERHEERYVSWMDLILTEVYDSVNPFEELDTPFLVQIKNLFEGIGRVLGVVGNILKFFTSLVFGFRVGTSETSELDIHQRTEANYLRFKSTFTLLWAIIMGNADGCGIPLDYTSLDPKDNTGTQSLLMLDLIWKNYLSGFVEKNESEDAPSLADYGDQYKIDSILAEDSEEYTQMKDWISNPKYQAETYKMSNEDADIYYFFKSRLLDYGPYSIGIITQEMKEGNSIEPMPSFDDNYLIIAEFVGTDGEYNYFNWFTSLDKNFKLTINPFYLEFGVSELEFISTIEILLNFFPVMALYEDIRDAYIVQSPFFRALAKIQIPIDIIDIFTRGVLGFVVNGVINSLKCSKFAVPRLADYVLSLAYSKNTMSSLTKYTKTGWELLQYTVFLPWTLFMKGMRYSVGLFGKAFQNTAKILAKLPSHVSWLISSEILIRAARQGTVIAMMETLSEKLGRIVDSNNMDKFLGYVVMPLSPTAFFGSLAEGTSNQLYSKDITSSFDFGLDAEIKVDTSTQTKGFTYIYTKSIGNFFVNIFKSLKNIGSSNTYDIQSDFDFVTRYYEGKITSQQDAIDILKDISLRYLSPAERAVKDVTSEKEFRKAFPELVEEMNKIGEMMKKDGWNEEAFLQIARGFSDWLSSNKGTGSGLNIYKGELPFFDMIYGMYRIAYYGNLYIDYVIKKENLSGNAAKLRAIDLWENVIIPRNRLAVGYESLPVTGKMKESYVDGELRIVQDGLITYDYETMKVGICLDELSLTLNSLNVAVTDIVTRKLFYASRLGNDWISWNTIIEMKDSNAHGASRLSDMFKASTSILKKMQSGTLRNLMIDSKTLSEVNLEGLTDTQLKEIAKNYMGEIALEFLQRSGVNNQNLPAGNMDPKLIFRLAAKYNLMGIAFGHYRQRLAFVNVANGRTDANLNAKFKPFSAIYDPKMISDLSIAPGFYPSIDKTILQKVFSDTVRWGRDILDGKEIEFAFTTQLRSTKTDRFAKEILVYGLKNGDQVDIYYSDYWDVTSVYKAKKTDTSDNTITENDYLEEVFVDVDDASIGRDIFINQEANGNIAIIVNKNPYQISDPNQESWLGLYRPDVGNTIYKSISPSSFYEPIKIQIDGQDRYCLALRDRSGELLSNYGYFDLSRGLMYTLHDSQNIESIDDIDFNIIRDAKQQMYRFYTTRTLPVIDTIVSEDGKYQAGLAYKDVSFAIDKINSLLEGITTDFKLTLKGDVAELKAVFYKLQELKSIRSNENFNLQTLFVKLTDTLNYYKDLQNKAPHLEVYMQEVKGEILADPLYFIHHVTVATEHVSMDNFADSHWEAYFNEQKYVKYDFDGYYLYNKGKNDNYKESPIKYRSLAIEMVDQIYLRRRSSNQFMKEYTTKNGFGEGLLGDYIGQPGAVGRHLATYIQESRNILGYGFTGAIDRGNKHFENFLAEALKDAKIFPSKYETTISDVDKSGVSIAMNQVEKELDKFLVNNEMLADLYRNKMLTITKHPDYTTGGEDYPVMKLTWLNRINIENIGRKYFTLSPLFTAYTRHNLVEISLFKHYAEIFKNGNGAKTHRLYLEVMKVMGQDGINQIKNAISIIEPQIGGLREGNRHTVRLALIDSHSLLNAIRILSLVDVFYKSTFTINEMIADSRLPLLNRYLIKDYGPAVATNTYIGFKFDQDGDPIISSGIKKEKWDINPYLNDYGVVRVDGIPYYKEEFDKIFDSKILMPAAVVKINPSNPKADTILVHYIKEAITEFKIAQKIEGTYGKQQREDMIKLEEGKYGIKNYEPEQVTWFKNFYKKWIELFAGEYM